MPALKNHKRPAAVATTYVRLFPDVLSCGCCRGPESDRCCCHIHQDTPRGLRPHKCSRHGGAALAERGAA